MTSKSSMVSRTSSSSGFTLIEVMLVVGILGVLAAIAIPSLGSYMRRARTSEAPANLSALFKSASAMYVSELPGRGIVATAVTNCVAEPTSMQPSDPNDSKQKFTAVEGFLQLNFHVGDYVYFGYGIRSIGTDGTISCLANGNSQDEIYTFFAHGDLNDDDAMSTFEMAVASDAESQLYHARGLYIVQELY